MFKGEQRQKRETKKDKHFDIKITISFDESVNIYKDGKLGFLSSIFTLSCGRHGQVNVISNSPNNIYMVDNGFVGINIQMKLFVKTTLYAFMLHVTVRTENGMKSCQNCSGLSSMEVGAPIWPQEVTSYQYK